MSHSGVSQIWASTGRETLWWWRKHSAMPGSSTTGQDLDAQLAALSAAGVEPQRVFTDTLSGSAKTARPGLAAMLDYARAGDTVVVAAIDRLGRSVAEVTRTIADLGERRITLRALREGVDTDTSAGAPSPPSWPPSPNWNLSSTESAGRPPVNPAEPEACPATKPPKLSPDQQEHCAACRDRWTGARAGRAFGIGRATAYRYLAEGLHRFLPRKLGPVGSLNMCRTCRRPRRLGVRGWAGSGRA